LINGIANFFLVPMTFLPLIVRFWALYYESSITKLKLTLLKKYSRERERERERVEF
jgi:hypothetical protein